MDADTVPRSTRLTFSRMCRDDLDDMHRLLGDQSVMSHYPRPRSRDEALEWIEWNLRNYARDGFGLWLLRDEHGSFVGDCGLTWQRVDHVDHLELGYHVVPDHQGRGYASEAAAACRDHARARGVDHLIAIIRPSNVPSQKVAMNVGMVLERETVQADGLAVEVYGMNVGQP